ncbi:hypothetical protein H8E52_09135 [bacterium]|nr:hypothetical protein [bacterium]
MDWIPESLTSLMDGHGRQLLIAAELAVLGTLFMLLVYRLKLRRKNHRLSTPVDLPLAPPKAEVEALYKRESALLPEPALHPDPERLQLSDNEADICPPEISRRIDKLEERVRGLALRAQP